jgi:hypothetical protein
MRTVEGGKPNLSEEAVDEEEGSHMKRRSIPADGRENACDGVSSIFSMISRRFDRYLLGSKEPKDTRTPTDPHVPDEQREGMPERRWRQRAQQRKRRGGAC